MSHAVSIHVGVDQPGGAPGDLPARLADSEAAAWLMAELASQAGYDSMLVLRGPTATLGAVNAALWNVSQLLGEGDTLLVTFSGHGGQVADKDGDDALGSDESWSLHDGELLDDTLAGYWRLFRPGVRIVVVSESCYSGGMNRGDDHSGVQWPVHSPARRRMRGMRPVYRGEPEWSAQAVANANRFCVAAPPVHANAIHATVLMLTASGEHQPAQAGLFTRCLLDVWAGGEFAGTYCDLYRAVKERVMRIRSDQEPQILMLGAPDMEFPLGRAFHRTRRGGGRSRDVVYR